MSMSASQAHTAVATSAIVVFGLYAYRKMLAGIGAGQPVASTGQFVTGFFFLYLTLSVMAEAAPALGGMFAWLVMAGDLLANGQPLVKDLNHGLGQTAKTTTPTRKGA